MKYLVLAAAASLSLAACTTDANRGISAGSQTDTMRSSQEPARPVQAGGAASSAPAGGTMALPNAGGQTTATPATRTTSGTALRPPTDTMTPADVTRPR